MNMKQKQKAVLETFTKEETIEVNFHKRWEILKLIDKSMY